MRCLSMAIRSANAYVRWIRRFILTNDMRHPGELREREAEAFLTDLAVRGQVAASTRNQALSTLWFLYGEVLGLELPWMDGIGTSLIASLRSTRMCKWRVRRDAQERPLSMSLVGFKVRMPFQ